MWLQGGFVLCTHFVLFSCPVLNTVAPVVQTARGVLAFLLSSLEHRCTGSSDCGRVLVYIEPMYRGPSRGPCIGTIYPTLLGFGGIYHFILSYIYYFTWRVPLINDHQALRIWVFIHPVNLCITNDLNHRHQLAKDLWIDSFFVLARLLRNNSFLAKLCSRSQHGTVQPGSIWLSTLPHRFFHNTAVSMLLYEYS